jgi:hypothetical protein
MVVFEIMLYVHIPKRYQWYTCTYHGAYHGIRLRTGEQVPSQDDHPWNPQTRTTTETVLREAMQALVRRPTCLRGLWWRSALHAADIAVELEPQL